MMEIREVNFAVSNHCNADCIFCPRSFVKVPQEDRFMSVATVERVLSQVSEPEFLRDHPVVHHVVGENGELFLNPNALDILRAVRKTGRAVSMFSNFSLLTPQIAAILLKEHLADTIHMNYDGASKGAYYAAKRLPQKRTEENLLSFLELRKEMNTPTRLCIHIVPAKKYHDAVVRSFGVPPAKANGSIPPDDSVDVLNQFGTRLREGDWIGVESILLWAEKFNTARRQGDFKCVNLERVKHISYVNPKGDWYACCFDVGNELVVGNVNEQSMAEIANGQERKNLVARLEAQEFDRVGFPCSRVDACQVIEG